MQKYCQVLISAKNKKEADKVSDALIKKKLVAGTLILKGPSRYWWNEKIVEKTYYNISTFSLFKYKKEIILIVKKNHRDKCPIIAFSQIDGNDEFLTWIEECLK